MPLVPYLNDQTSCLIFGVSVSESWVLQWVPDPLQVSRSSPPPSPPSSTASLLQDNVDNQHVNKENVCPPNTLFGVSVDPPPPPPAPPLRTPSGEDIRAGLRYVHGWPERDLETLRELCGGEALRLLGRNLGVTTFSSACSGVDAPGTALRQITEQFNLLTGLHVEHPQHIHATELDDECRAELEAHPSPPQCLFKDLQETWEAPVAKKIRTLLAAGFSIPVNELVPLVLSKKAVKKFAFCSRHGRCCPIRPARCHFAGLPCVDWSPQGQRKKGGGATAVIFAVWAATRLAVGDHIIIHENAAAFDPSLLMDVFSHQYIVESCIVRATDRGLPARRDRRWSVMVHRELVRDKVLGGKYSVELTSVWGPRLPSLIGGPRCTCSSARLQCSRGAKLRVRAEGFPLMFFLLVSFCKPRDCLRLGLNIIPLTQWIYSPLLQV